MLQQNASPKRYVTTKCINKMHHKMHHVHTLYKWRVSLLVFLFCYFLWEGSLLVCIHLCVVPVLTAGPSLQEVNVTYLPLL